MALDSAVTRLEARIRRMLSRAEDGEDLLQEVALACCQAGGSDKPDSPEAFVFALARNRRTDMLRKQRYRRAESLDSDVLDRRAREMDRLEKSELYEIVDDQPGEYRDVLRDRFFNGRSLQEIARSRGEDPECVKSRFRRALAHLRNDRRVESYRPE